MALCGVALAFAVGRWSVKPLADEASSAVHQPADLEAVESSAEAPGRAPIQTIVKYVERCSHSSSSDGPPSDAAVAGERVREARDLLSVLRTKVKNTYAPEGATAEFTVRENHQYMMGWVDALTRTAADLTDELAAEVETVMCGGDATPGERASLAHIAQALPELVTDKWLECATSPDAEEDVVLWSALDAWRTSGLGRTASINDLAKRAEDPRTLRRLRPPEEVEAERHAAAGHNPDFDQEQERNE